MMTNLTALTLQCCEPGCLAPPTCATFSVTECGFGQTLNPQAASMTCPATGCTPALVCRRGMGWRVDGMGWDGDASHVHFSCPHPMIMVLARLDTCSLTLQCCVPTCASFNAACEALGMELTVDEAAASCVNGTCTADQVRASVPDAEAWQLLM
jgi:hypothetical protein